MAWRLLPLVGALFFGGLALLVAAQLRLGASWRIGIEEGAAPGLVTDGLYRVCRNPIFLALLVTLAGYALLLPTWLSLGLVVGAWAAIRPPVGGAAPPLRRAAVVYHGAPEGAQPPARRTP
jgi:protein-S-isoprenylcysteine O-methyltransferase Ste14